MAKRAARGKLGVGLALIGVALALPAQGQDAPAASPQAASPPGASAAVNVLVRQADRWLAQDRLDLAAPAIERALQAEPNNPSALSVAARLEVARGNRDAANAYLARLGRTGATEQAAQVQGAIRAATIDRTGLEEARRLAQEGRSAAAAARYRALFGNQPPPEAFAQEYYEALAGAEGTRAEGVQNLSRLATRPNATARDRLAYARALTYAPATRMQGMQALAALASAPDVGAEARRAWAQAIGFGGNDPGMVPQAEAYLARFPDDAAMRSRLQSLRSAVATAPPPDPEAAARAQAFQRLEAGQLGDSAQRFQAILRDNPNDADALGGLGVIRLREGNPTAARDLLERAIAADATGGRRWQSALDAAIYPTEVATGRAELRRGALDAAEAAARRAAQREVADRSDAETLLAEITLRRGDAAAAETRFRAVLARRPSYGPAQAGLTQALRAQGRAPEPRLAAAPSLAEPAFVGGGAPTPPAAASLRDEAARTADPDMAVALLRNAVSTAPDDPWTRLDLARALRRQGRGGEGRALVEELAFRAGTPDAAYAAALLAEEDGRTADADAFLTRIPPARRTADMGRLATRIRAQREVQAAVAQLGVAPIEARTQLLGLAARPDPTGGVAAAVIRAFGDANDRFGAAEAGRVASIANRNLPAARIAIAGALVSAGLEAEAVALAAEVEASGVSPGQQRDLAALRAGAGIRAADRLNEAGDQAAAFERLRPALAAADNRDAQLALARLYISARQPREALRIAETVLARDPRNVDARRAAVEAALATGNRTRAMQLLAEGQTAPGADARMLLLEARVAREAGDGARAQRALEAASRQRAAELGTGARGVAMQGGVGGTANPFGPAAVARPAGQPTDPLTREIQQELAAIADEVSPTVTVNAAGRTRSGDAGLDQLSDLSSRIEGGVGAPVIGGRVTAFVQPVAIEAGTQEDSAQARTRFGSAALNAAGTLPPRPEGSASGVGLGAGYTRGEWLRLDFGTTPIGFSSWNFVGGAEIAPRLTDGGLRLRLRGERRAVEDSLLSWAGATDPRTNTTWGPVLRTGGRAQIEFPLGRGFGYVGGGYSVFEGEGVASNSRIEGGAGLSVPVWTQEDGELTVGTDLVYLAYDKNLRFFTLGHGGYFSPQQYTALNFPVDYRGRNGDLSYRVGATVGYASWREDSAPYFPNDAAAQAQLAFLASSGALGSGVTVNSTYPSQAQAGFVGSLRGDLDYALNPRLSIGAGVTYDKAADFDETRFQLRLRNRF